MNQAKVGIFFIVKGSLIYDATSMDQGELYGDAINYSGHFDYWEALNPKTIIELAFKSFAYDHFPRGRVVYFKTNNTFKVYADACITKSEIAEIVTTFQLPAYQLGRDEHYQCAICNPNYLD